MLKKKYIGCYQQLVINLCEPPVVWGFWGEETTATFHSCFFEIPPPQLTFTFTMWGSHEKLFSGRPSDADLPQAWPFPGSHHLQPCPRQVGPLVHHICHQGSSQLWLIRYETSQKMNSTIDQVSLLGYLLLEHLFVRVKIKVIYLAKPDVYIFIPRKLFNSDSVVCSHIPISKILQTCICILFYFKGSA